MTSGSRPAQVAGGAWRYNLTPERRLDGQARAVIVACSGGTATGEPGGCLTGEVHEIRAGVGALVNIDATGSVARTCCVLERGMGGMAAHTGAGAAASRSDMLRMAEGGRKSIVTGAAVDGSRSPGGGYFLEVAVYIGTGSQRGRGSLGKSGRLAVGSFCRRGVDIGRHLQEPVAMGIGV